MNITEAILYKIVAGEPELKPSDLVFKGVWNASGGTYPLTPAKGHYYIISVGGTLPLGAVLPNEWIYYGTVWGKTPALTTGVTLVNGLTGNVTLTADNIADFLIKDM